MNTSFYKYSSSLSKLYQYSNWELPATNVILSHSLLSLSGYKNLIEQKQSTIPHLLDETFYQLSINEHYKLCKYYSLENIQKQEEEKKIQAKKLNDYEIIENIEYKNILHQSKLIEN